ncbi:MAG: NACHT domain-containing protein [Muribaculaceae bacterium]|nr:NACHT domain-containing protein [Muribaculaceae bacterium]
MIEPVVTAQVVKSLMDYVVIPKISDFTSEIKKQWNLKVVTVNNHFYDYFIRTYDQLSIMNTLALKNQQLSLLSIYQPLTISIDFSKRESTKIEKIPYELIDKYQRILITDTAGMGKSTISKYIFLKMVEDKCAIPIFIELRKLSKKNTLIDEIISMLNGIEEKMDKELLICLLKKGGFYFILDGFDEIALANRDEVVEDLKIFIKDLSEKNCFILTSRPESMLSAFGDFKSFQILPLKENEAYSLLSKYDGNGETSSKLIAELKTERNKTVREFLKNPLLVSLLFIVYDHKATIPLKKHLFYSQIYDALFEDHDLSKGAQNIHIKRSGLDRDDFEKILRYLGFQSFQSNSIQYSKDQMLALIDKASGFWTSLKVQPSDVLKDLVTAVPLFVKDGLEYKWAHKSLSEYFAAKFIFLDTKEKQVNLLSQLYKSDNLPRYINLLDLYYDLDIIGFKKCILLPLLESYLSYLSCFDEASMSYFLRNLYFLRNIKFKFSSVQTDQQEESKSFEKAQRRMKIYAPSDLCISVVDNTKRNATGRRMLLLKLYEKGVHSVKSFHQTHLKFDWIESLEKDKWYEFEQIIKIAEEKSDKLGEICELIAHFDRSDTIYMEKEDIKKEINLIQSELDAQSCDFHL